MVRLFHRGSVLEAGNKPSTRFLTEELVELFLIRDVMDVVCQNFWLKIENSENVRKASAFNAFAKFVSCSNLNFAL